MAGRTRSRPICTACNRPFDPTSPGSTRTMGPTCAKRAGLSPLTGTAHPSELNLTFDDILMEMPRIHASPEEKFALKRKKLMMGAPAHIPKSLREKHQHAKIAFDELLRLFLSDQSVHYGNDALKRYEEICTGSVEIHSFGDQSLKWLEPEYDIHLLHDRACGKYYYWRVFNETPTLVEIDEKRWAEAREPIAVIVAYSQALASHRKRDAHHQLTFDLA